MSYLERLNWGAVEPRLQRIFQHFHAERGNVPNLFRVLGRKPKLLNSFNAHFAAVMAEDKVSTRLKEILVCRVSAINDCGY